jgi:O-antigen/teichoic acid export membrane protein
MSRLRSALRAPAAAGTLQVLGVALLNALLAFSLARQLSPLGYGRWIVLIQISTALNILEFGCTHVLTRRVQVALVADGTSGVRREFGSGKALAATILKYACLLLVCVQIVGRIVGAPTTVISVVPFAIHGLAYVAASPFHGLLRGLNRLHTSVLVALGGRAVGYILVVLVARSSSDVFLLGCGLLAGSIVSQVVLATVTSEWRAQALKQLVATQFSEGLPLAFANLSVLLITGADVLVVGGFARKGLPTYANGAALVSLATGYQWAIFAGLPRRMAELTAQGNRDQIARMVVRLTRHGVGVVACAAGLVGWLLPTVLSVWIGRTDAGAISAVRWLLFATVVRNLFVVWSLTLLGTGDYLRVRWVPYAEAAMNLLASVGLASRYGAVGAALGTLVGGLASGTIYLCWGLRRTLRFEMARSRFAVQGIAAGLAAGIPYVLLVFVVRALDSHGTGQSVSLFIATCISVLIVWRVALDDEARALARTVWVSLGLGKRR